MRHVQHELSADDGSFRAALEACRIAPGDFDHRAHIRLAYVYLAENDADTAAESMRTTLLAFLRHNNIDVLKYHATITRAWILAVQHFMDISPAALSADAFIAANPILLDSRIMLTHYSADLLFSPMAREAFVEPDLDAIPPIRTWIQGSGLAAPGI